MSEPIMLLCIGLQGRRGLGSIAPRLVSEDGAIVVAQSLPRDRVPTCLAERVTYLAGVLGPGLYDAEVVSEPAGVEVPIVYPVPLETTPAWARDLFDEKQWTSPAVRAR